MKKGGSGAGDKKAASMVRLSRVSFARFVACLPRCLLSFCSSFGQFKRRNWKTRCVTLSAKCLMYYESEEAAEKGSDFAKGGMFFAGATMEIFEADDERKRGHQFYLTGQTVDGGYGGARDLVMCAQSAAEYVEWERLLLTHIARANGGDMSELTHDEVDKTGYELLVHDAFEGPDGVSTANHPTAIRHYANLPCLPAACTSHTMPRQAVAADDSFRLSVRPASLALQLLFTVACVLPCTVPVLRKTPLMTALKSLHAYCHA